MGTIRLDGEVAIVTGAGHGLGRAYACALAERGAAVVCNDVVGERAAETVAAIASAGGTAVAEDSSVATPDGGAAIVEAAIDAFGRVDALVNNAGQLRNAAFDEMTVDDFLAVIDTHLAGAFYVTQPAYRHMSDGGLRAHRVHVVERRDVRQPLAGRATRRPRPDSSDSATWSRSRVPQHGILANAIMPMALTGIGRAGRRRTRPTCSRRRPPRCARSHGCMTVDNVAPLVVYLASRACTETRRVFSVGCRQRRQGVRRRGAGLVRTASPEPMTPEAARDHVSDGERSSPAPRSPSR